jgi:hypothetical protein
MSSNIKNYSWKGESYCVFHFFILVIIDAHGLKIQGEGQGGFCQILGGRVYRGCENFGGRVPLFGVLLHFY